MKPGLAPLNLRQLMEHAVCSVGMTCYRFPWITLAIVAVTFGLLASQLPKTHFVTDLDRYLEATDPTRMRYDEFRDRFGRDDFLIVSVTPPEVFDAGFLDDLAMLHERLENELPYVEEVTSLVNVRQTRGVDESLVVGELLGEWSTGPKGIGDLAELERVVVANPWYRDVYLSSDARTVGLIVRPQTFESTDVDELAGFDDDAPGIGADLTPTFLSDERVAELVVSALRLADEIRATGLEIALSGTPVINHEIQQQTKAEMARFSALSMAAIALTLALVFRRFSAVLLPLAIVAVALGSTMGTMAWVGRPLTFASQIVPSFILAVGVGFVVHILAIFYQQIDQGTAGDEAAERALRQSGPALAMSSLTTVGGMLSFVPTGLIPVRDVGIFVPLGVGLAALLALTALPACLALVPVAARSRETVAQATAIETILVACGRFGTRHPIGVPAVAALLTALVVTGIPRIDGDYDPFEWLPEDNVARVGTDIVDARMGGVMTSELILDSGRSDGLRDPELLTQIERIQRYAEGLESTDIEITKTISIADVAKEIHQALHGGDPSRHVLADDARLLAQELLLFENSGSDDLEDVADSQLRYARITLKSRQAGAAKQARFLDEHMDPIRRLAPGAEVHFTGFVALATSVADQIIATTISSYAIAFLAITPLMILFIGSLRTGIVSIVPNLMPILMVLGVMGWSDVPLDIVTVLIGGIALGLVVDDTIHILHCFAREFASSGNVETAVAETMRTTGRAILLTTVVLMTAFSIYGLADTETVSNFGRLTALAIVLAFLFDLFVAPALLALVYTPSVARRPMARVAGRAAVSALGVTP